MIPFNKFNGKSLKDFQGWQLFEVSKINPNERGRGVGYSQGCCADFSNDSPPTMGVDGEFLTRPIFRPF